MLEHLFSLIGIRERQLWGKIYEKCCYGTFKPYLSLHNMLSHALYLSKNWRFEIQHLFKVVGGAIECGIFMKYNARN